jgi:hypothetical protein
MDISMRHSLAAWLCVASMASCKSPADHAEPAPAASTTSTGVPSASAAPAVPKTVSAQVVHLKADEVTATEMLPAGTHGHGEALRGLWTAEDGTTFGAGFMFTGTPGHDTGTVYRRSPGESAWQVVYTTPENELGRVWGRNAGDVYAAGMKVLAHFDGKAWAPVTIPRLEGSISGVWGNATDLWVTAGHQYTAHVYHCDSAGSWGVEAKTDVMLFNVGGAGASVWAVGSSGAVFHREPDGHWKQETEDKRAQYQSVWASGEDDVWVAGTDLRHRRDGSWQTVTLPVEGPVRWVWGRGREDVFAGTAAGAFHLIDGRWKKTGFSMDSGAASGIAGEVLVAHNDIH